MARTRLLHPEFFRHEEIASLDPWARLLFQGLWTVADKEGRLEDRPRRIKADLFPYDDVDVDELLDVLVGRGFLVAYEAGGRGFLCVPSFIRWQNPHPKEKPSEIPGPESGAVRPRNYMASLVITETSRAVSNTVSDLDPVSDPETFAPPAEKQREAPPVPGESTPLVAFLAETYPDIRDPWAVERRAQAAFPGIDLLADAVKARGWELSDPKRRKVKHGRFLWDWWARTQERASGSVRLNGHQGKPKATAAPSHPDSWQEKPPF